MIAQANEHLHTQLTSVIVYASVVSWSVLVLEAYWNSIWDLLHLPKPKGKHRLTLLIHNFLKIRQPSIWSSLLPPKPKRECIKKCFLKWGESVKEKATEESVANLSSTDDRPDHFLVKTPTLEAPPPPLLLLLCQIILLFHLQTLGGKFLERCPGI